MGKNYFEHNGKKYYEGTIVEFNNTGYPQAKYGKYYGNADLFTLMKSPTESFANDKRLIIANMCGNDRGQIVRVVKEVDKYSKVEKVKAYNDTDCDDMFYAWIAYIAAMVFFTLFYNRIGWWALTTVIFYNYRKSKLYVSKESYERKNRSGGI